MRWAQDQAHECTITTMNGVEKEQKGTKTDRQTERASKNASAHKETQAKTVNPFCNIEFSILVWTRVDQDGPNRPAAPPPQNK